VTVNREAADSSARVRVMRFSGEYAVRRPALRNDEARTFD
jgi:hypothetical protein